jgi:hypothetical protein
MTKKMTFLLVLYFLSTFFSLNIAYAQSGIELHRDIWESEYSRFRETVSNIEINKYRGKDALIGLEKIQFYEQKNQINSTRYIYEYSASKPRQLQKVSTWIEQFDKNNRLVSKTWKFAKNSSSKTQDPFESFVSDKTPPENRLIPASSEYSMKVTYSENNLVPSKIDFFDSKYGNVAIDKISLSKSRILIIRKSIVKLYTNSDFDFYSTKQIDFDKSGRRVLEVFPSAKWEYLYSETGQLNSVTLFLTENKTNKYQISTVNLYDFNNFLKSQKFYVQPPAIIPKGCEIKEKDIYSGYDYSYNLDDRKNWINRLEYGYGCFGGSISEKLERKIAYKK